MTEDGGDGGRVLGVDVGTVRTGVAVSDVGRRVAGPLTTVAGGKDLVERLAALAGAQQCATVVVGLPRSLSGSDTDSTRRSRAVADGLRARGLRVELWDERLSSVAADRALVQAGRRRERRREERDRVAATLILQGWLDAQR
jgi:putative holliday junction resolvase